MTAPLAALLRDVRSALGFLQPAALVRALGRSLYRCSLLYRRALRQTMRDGATNVARLGVAGIIALIVGTVFKRKVRVYLSSLHLMAVEHLSIRAFPLTCVAASTAHQAACRLCAPSYDCQPSFARLRILVPTLKMFL
jgi:hypothetical protein